jgi:hypothetical protein
VAPEIRIAAGLGISQNKGKQNKGKTFMNFTLSANVKIIFTAKYRNKALTSKKISGSVTTLQRL